MARLFPVASVNIPDMKHPNGTHNKFIEPENENDRDRDAVVLTDKCFEAKFYILNHDICTSVKENS